MDIPFYSDIYAFPSGPRHHHHPPKPHFKKSQVVETSKEVIINDAVGHTRYAVRLVSEYTEEGLGFQVQVIHFYPTDTEEDNDLLLTIPEEGLEYDYRKIEKEFKICVQRYDSLVRAEVQDFRGIDVYKDKIGYEKTAPECCAFCKWCRQAHHHDHCHCHEMPKLECHNPKNEKQFTYMVDDWPFPNKKAHRYCHDGWQKLPWMRENPFKRIPLREDEILDRIFPTVDLFGKCKNFEKADYLKKPFGPHHDDCHCHSNDDASSNSPNSQEETSGISPDVPQDSSLENTEDGISQDNSGN